MRNDYKQDFLDEFKRLTNIDDLTMQDVIGAMYIMFKNYQLRKASSGPIYSKKQLTYLHQELLNGDDFYSSGLSNFKDAVRQTRHDRKARVSKEELARRQEQERIHYYDDCKLRSPEEDMSFVSNELLNNDDIFYESVLFNKFKKNNRDLFLF